MSSRTEKKINSFAHTMQISPNLDEPKPLNSFCFHRSFEAFQFSDKLKTFRNGLFKVSIKTTEVMYELLTFHQYRKNLIPY